MTNTQLNNTMGAKKPPSNILPPVQANPYGAKPAIRPPTGIDKPQTIQPVTRPYQTNNSSFSAENAPQAEPTTALAGGLSSGSAPSFGRNVQPSTNLMLPTAEPTTMQATPGGLIGNVNNNRYGDQSGFNGRGGDGRSHGQYGFNYTSGNNGGGGGASTGGMSNFDQFRDSALEQAMRQLNPQIDSQNDQFEQMMVSRGIQPGTAQYDAQRANLDRRNNDLLRQANYGAQQQGLAAQQQDWNQGYQYDALANALNQSRIGAQASMYGSDASANASMHNAGLANALGMNRLNQQSREFDINDIYRNQQMDLQGAMGYGNLDLRQQGQDLANWQAQQQANQNWYNNNSGMLGNAPGMNFTPSSGYVNNQQHAGQLAQQNQNQQDASTASLLASIAQMYGAYQSSDKRLKENIVYTDTVDGVRYYDFDYIDKTLGADRYNGVIAQEIMKSHSDAIIQFGEYYMVNYSKLPRDMKSIEKRQEAA